jgi:hypothetical protein
MFACLLFALLLSVTSESRAAPRMHDGFYLQLTLGVGAVVHHSLATFRDPGPPQQATYSESGGGPAVAGSLLMGGSLRPGLVLGGGVLGVTSFVSLAHERDGVPIDVEDGGGPFFVSVGVIGPFIDYYPHPTRGFHVQGMAGYATYNGPHAGNSFDTPRGIGLMAGVGYDWWVGKEWSVGLLARCTFVSTWTSDHPYPGGGSAPGDRPTAVAPTFGVAFTYN